MTSHTKPTLIITILLATIITLASAIAVPITKDQYRCMVVYTQSQDEDIKIDVRFPKLSPKQSTQNHEEYFVIWINNTETFQADFYRAQPGQTFRRQLSLEPNIMYKVCFRLNTTSLAPMQPIDIEYESYHQFRIMNNDRHNIKLPDSILKHKDFKDSYDDALMMLEMTQRQLALNKVHQQDQQKIFDYISSRTDYLVMISALEVGFIVIIGLLQFYVIRKHLIGELRL